jgi:hypothetical protein
MGLLASIEKEYAIIDKTAGKYLYKLTCDNIVKDIILSAEIAGLKLLRANTTNDLSKIDPGIILLGAVPDDAYDLIYQFIYGWVISNGLNPKNLDKAKLSADLTRYLPEVSQFELPFDEICQENNIKVDYHPYVATSSALELVSAGKKMKLLDPKVGLAMMMYHINASSKTVPYPVNIE